MIILPRKSDSHGLWSLNNNITQCSLTPNFYFTHLFFSNLGYKTTTARNENKERGENIGIV